MDMNTEGPICRNLVKEKCKDGDSCYNTTGPTVLHQPPNIIIYVCQVWMHSGVINHLPLGTVDLTATGEVTWREVPEVRKAVWTAATALSKTTKPFPLFGLSIRAQLFRVMPSLHVYICSNCVCFKVHSALLFSCKCSIALKETRVKKSETFCFKHQHLWVKQLHICCLLFSYL